MPCFNPAEWYAATAGLEWAVLRRCDRCKRRRLLYLYVEAYPPLGSNHGWWYECAQCALESSAAWGEAAHALLPASPEEGE